MERQARLALLVAVLGGLVGVASATRSFLPLVFGVSPATLGIASIGVTVVTFLLSPVALFGAGYWAGWHTDVTADYGSLALVFGLVGGVATALGFLVLVVAAAPSVLAHSGGQAVVLAATNGFFRLFDFAITGLAGAAVASFRRG